MPQVDFVSFFSQVLWLLLIFWIMVFRSLYLSVKVLSSSNKRIWRLNYRKGKFLEYFYKNLDAAFRVISYWKWRSSFLVLNKQYTYWQLLNEDILLLEESEEEEDSFFGEEFSFFQEAITSDENDENDEEEEFL